jgi:hypothetical protein
MSIFFGLAWIFIVACSLLMSQSEEDYHDRP